MFWAFSEKIISLKLFQQAHPVPVLFSKENFGMKHLLVFEDVVDSPRDLMGKVG